MPETGEAGLSASDQSARPIMMLLQIRTWQEWQVLWHSRCHQSVQTSSFDATQCAFAPGAKTEGGTRRLQVEACRRVSTSCMCAASCMSKLKQQHSVSGPNGTAERRLAWCMTKITPCADPMRKAAYREVIKVVQAADVVIQVLDARDPAATRSTDIEQLIRRSSPSKRIILLLNKIGARSHYYETRNYYRRTTKKERCSAIKPQRAQACRGHCDSLALLSAGPTSLSIMCAWSLDVFAFLLPLTLGHAPCHHGQSVNVASSWACCTGTIQSACQCW